MTHTIEKTVENYMEACHMLDGVQNIVAGVSGGPEIGRASCRERV